MLGKLRVVCPYCYGILRFSREDMKTVSAFDSRLLQRYRSTKYIICPRCFRLIYEVDYPFGEIKYEERNGVGE